MASISPGIKVGFEQKYVMCLITALVTNAWHSFQLLHYGIEIESMTNTKVKQSIKWHGTCLKDFVFQLALALIRSTDERMYYVDNITTLLDLPVLPFEWAESTLMEQLSEIKWPKRFKIRHFNKNKDLVELCLTHINVVKHEVVQLVRNHGKNHCSFCYSHPTTYGCNLSLQNCDEGEHGHSFLL
jgi:hypothetical protein